MIRLLRGDCRALLPTLPADSVQCCVTSPPYYGLRDYGCAGQIGLEPTPEAYVAELVAVFREVRRVLHPSGTVWLNLGDSYAGYWGDKYAHKPFGKDRTPDASTPPHKKSPDFKTWGIKPKDLLGMPWRVAFALQADGWWLRSAIVWAKPNPMPESVTDRPASAYEHVFLLAKSASYYYDAEAIAEEAVCFGRQHTTGIQPPKVQALQESGHHGRGGDLSINYERVTRNARNVWTIATEPFSEWTPQVSLVPVPSSEVPALDASGHATADDISRITSPDCSLHAGRPDWVPTGFCDGLSADQLSRMRDTFAHPAQDMPPDSETIQHTPARSCSRPSSSDCSGLEDAETATLNSIGSHRTDLDRLFSERAISSEKTASDKPRTAPLRSQRALTCRSTAESRSEVDSSGGCGLGTAGGSARMSGACCCGYYRKVVSKTSHFATFPLALADRCIRAGTSEPGCCAQCGAPWARVVERPPSRGDWNAPDAGLVAGQPNGLRGAAFYEQYTPPRTTGWAPSCQCDAPTQPCTVLDPFAGAGTTLLAADRLQRHAIGIELSETYAAMSETRIRSDAPLLAEIA